MAKKMKFGPVLIDTESYSHPNRWPFSGVLCLLDFPSDRAVRGARGHRVVLPRGVAEHALPSILGMAVDYRADFRGHDVRKKVGVITSARIVDAPYGDPKVPRLHVSGHIFARDFPDVVLELRKNPRLLGMSYEADVQVAHPAGDVWVLTEVVFTGAAILEADAAAWRGTMAAEGVDNQAITDESSQAVVAIPTGHPLLKNITPFGYESIPGLVIDAHNWLGPDLVHKYAERIKASFEFRARGKSSEEREELRLAIDEQYQRFEDVAYEMQRWQMAHGDEVKWPE
jgi:hypothetical protein